MDKVGGNERGRKNGVVQVEDEVGWSVCDFPLCFLSLHSLSTGQIRRGGMFRSTKLQSQSSPGDPYVKIQIFPQM